MLDLVVEGRTTDKLLDFSAESISYSLFRNKLPLCKRNRKRRSSTMSNFKSHPSLSESVTEIGRVRVRMRRKGS